MKVAGCILTLARPQYLRKSIESIESCKGKEKLDWYIFQDGGYNKHSDSEIVPNEREMNIAHKILKKSDLPNKIISRNEYNAGIAKQYAKVFGLLDKEYDAVISFEDDIVVGENSINMMLYFLNKYPDYVPTVCSRPDKVDVENEIDTLIECKSATFNVIGMSENIYRSIEPRYDEYISMVNGIDYRERNHNRIKESFGSRLSSHDSVVNKLISDEGYNRLKPSLTRAVNIGMHGLHHSPKDFMEQHRYESGTITYEDDIKLMESDGYRIVKENNPAF